MTTQTCRACGEDKSLCAFRVDARYNCRERQCLDCRRQEIDEYRRTTLRGQAIELRSSAIARAKKAKLPLTITVDWVEQKLAAGRCEVTGLPLTLQRASGAPSRAFGPSLDRRDPRLGYTPENTQVTCWIYNRAKGVDGHAAVLKLAEALHVQA